MKKNKKGFTLIELLAVIVILAIIALIAIPIVLNIIGRVRKGAFTRSAENVLKASNLYYTNSLLDVKQLEDIRFECTNNECISSKLDENGNPINLNVDGNIGEGYVLITNKGEVEFLLQNGGYCAVKYQATKNITVKNETCSNIDITNDETAPIIDKINTIVTSNSITLTVSAYDNESGISGYQFSIDNGTTWTEYQTNNVYTYKNLTNNRTYKISVRVYNGTYGKENYQEEIGMSEKETEEISLKTIENPTFEITPEGWSTSKTVTINYPEGYTNEYSIDNGNTFLPYTEAITITENGNIIAKITDGANTITKTQMIERIDNTVPTINLDGIPDEIVMGDDYSLPTSYAVNNSLSGGNATCKVGNTTVTNTKELNEGTQTINCTVTTGTGVSQSVSKTIIVKYSIGTPVTLKDNTIWYVLEDNGTSVTLFASQNIKNDASGWTTVQSEYATPFDVNNAGLGSWERGCPIYESNGTTVPNDSTIKQFLEGNVTTYINSSLKANGGMNINSIRLITLQEICNIINVSNSDNNCVVMNEAYGINLSSDYKNVPQWLYSMDYWSMTPFTAGNYWNVFVIEWNLLKDGGVMNSTNRGARPVIVTNKSNIK